NQALSTAKNIPGLSYNGHLFVQVKSYARNQWENAVLRCREFLQLNVPVMSIIVKEATELTLWSKDESVVLVKNRSSSLVAQQSPRTKKQPTPVKYRGVEIKREKKIIISSQILKNPKLKYRGQSY
ncbi:MAG: hypothetical protein AB4038_01830, partial [Prochloraceae cyanobacterium]